MGPLVFRVKVAPRFASRNKFSSSPSHVCHSIDVVRACAWKFLDWTEEKAEASDTKPGPSGTLSGQGVAQGDSAEDVVSDLVAISESKVGKAVDLGCGVPIDLVRACAPHLFDWALEEIEDWDTILGASFSVEGSRGGSRGVHFRRERSVR